MNGSDNLEMAFEKSSNAKTTEITLMGDRNVIIQLVTLLSYIRNGINSRQQKDIRVLLNRNFGNSEFNFLVNNSMVDDLICKENIELN